MGLAASATWAAANVFIQKSSRAAGPFRALVWAQVVGALAALPLALLLDDRSGAIDAGVVVWAAVAAVAAIVAYACVFVSMERGRLSIVVPIMSSWSVVAAGLAIALGEAIRRSHLLGAGLVVAGVLIVSRFSGGSEPTDQPDEARQKRGALPAAIGAAVGFGVLIPAIDRLAPVVGRVGAIPLVFFFDLLLGVPLALMARVDLRIPSRRMWPAVAAAGLLETAGFVWISLGVERAPVAVVAPLSGLASALTVLFGWLVLRERPGAAVLAGAAIACAGVVTLAL